MTLTARPYHQIFQTTLMSGFLACSGCSAPFIGSVNFGLGDSVENGISTVENRPENCPSYHPMPPALKTYLVTNNQDNPTLDPWAGWLLRIRNWLEQGCP